MVFSLLPMAAYAEDDVTSSIETTQMQSDIQEEAPVETTTESDNEQPPAETSAPETETTPETTETAPEEPDAVRLLQNRIWALPSVEEFASAEEAEQTAVSNEIQSILDEYEALSAEEQALLDISRLEALFAMFSVSTMTEITIILDSNGAPTETGGTGWSYSSNKLTLNAGYTFTIDGICKVTVDNLGTIAGGTFDGTVNNTGTGTNMKATGGVISGGTFNGEVVNGHGWSTCKINDGIFNGAVKNQNHGQIYGGTFNGTVTTWLGSGIYDGTFNGSMDLDLGGYIYGGTFNKDVTLGSGGYIKGGMFNSTVAWNEESNRYKDVIQGGNSTLTFALNDGSWTEGYTVPTSYSFSKSQTTTLPASDHVKKEGYIFAGWFDNAELTGDAITEISVETFGAKTFYAKWTEEPEAEYQEVADGEWLQGNFADAVQGVYDGGTVRLLRDVTLAQTAVITKSVTITSADGTKMITSSTASHGYLLCIADSDQPTLTLSNVILDGGSVNGISASRALIAVGGKYTGQSSSSTVTGSGKVEIPIESNTYQPGKLVLNSAVIRNNTNATQSGVGGGICVIRGSVEMNAGSKITNCAAEQGGAVAMAYVSQSFSSSNTFTMNGGEMSGNKATTSADYGDGGGAVLVQAGTFTMNSGTMTGNTAMSGGAVNIIEYYQRGDRNHLYSTSNFIMNEGLITGNNASYGGAFYINMVDDCRLLGGEISGNKATNGYGGGLIVAPIANVELSGGIKIKGNTSTENGSEDNLYLDGYVYNGINFPTVTITGTLTGQIGISTWLKPQTTDISADSLLIASGNNYTITASDLAAMSSDNTEYSLKLLSESNTVVMVKHTHDWTYAASSDTVTATCSGNGNCAYMGNWPTLVLSAENMEYTGSVYNKASITKNDITTITGAAAGSITYEGRDGTTYAESETAPAAVGKYTAKVTIGGKTAAVDFEITRLAATTNVNFATDLTYNGKNQNLVKNATTTGGTLMYRLNNTDEWQAGLVMLTGKEAGDYHIQYYVKADANYADSTEQTATVTIKQKEVTVDGITAQDKTYDGKTTAMLDCSKAVFDGIVSGDDLTITASGAFEDRNAGTGKTVTISGITLSGDAAKNYKLAETGNQTTTTANIDPETLTVDITSGGGTYGGTITPASAALTGLVDGESVTPVLTYTGTSNDGTAHNSTEVPTKAGTYTVTAAITDGNYVLTGTNTAKFEVNRADPALSVTAVPEKNYGDASFKLEVSRNGNGALTYESNNTSVLTVDAEGNVTLHKAGNATITVKVDQTANYNADTKTVDVTVKKVSGNLEVTTLSYTKTYGDAPFQITDATSTTGTVSYTSSNEDVVTVATDGTVTIRNKGVATITVSVPEGDNHTAVSKEIQITVNPKAITVKAKDASKIYGDADPELTYEVLNNGLVGDDTLENIKVWRDKGENVVWLNDGKLGGYKISVAYNGTIIQSLLSVFGSDPNGNYTITYEPGVFTINPRNISGADVTLGNSLTYNGTEQTQTIAKVVAGGIEVPADAYTVTGNTAKNAGTYTLTITAKESGNFTGTRTVEYTIAKASETPTDPSKPSDPTKPTSPTKPGQTESPKTGDSSHMFLWFVLMLVGICGMSGTILISRKTRYKGRYTK